MQLRDLLVVLDGSARRTEILVVATGLAQRHDAYLNGLCSLDLLLPARLGYTLAGYPEFPAMLALQDVAAELEQEALAKARNIEAEFQEQLRRSGLRGDWELCQGPIVQAVTRRARTSDLLILGQADPDQPSPPAARNLVEGALMGSGRPVLLVPYAGRFNTIGRNVLIGWNGAREAARAVHDALLLIEPGAAVTVLRVDMPDAAPGPKDIPQADIAQHLARHGIRVSAASTVAAGISEADVLLNYASDLGADLLVVGGYGHSRAREMILGGVTRGLLEQVTLPVLMSH